MVKKKKAEQLRLSIDSVRTKFLEEDFEEEEQKYQAILEYCRQFNTVFHDGEFPHSKQSFVPKNFKLKHFYRTFTMKSHWRRLVEVDEEISSWTIFEDNPIYCYKVYQGFLGDCTIVGALTSISNNEQLIRQLLPSFEISEYGVYRVKLCVSGEWKMVVVDDWFPYRNSVRAFTIAGYNMLWASLIEKAIAKVSGSYRKIRGFYVIDALCFLTGAPTTRLNLQWDSKSWKFFKEASSKNYPMVCYSHSKACDKRGIVGYHVYSIINVCEVGSYRMVRVRNPWGIKHLKDRDEWKSCPEEVQSYLKKMYSPVPGAFFLQWTDFLQNFGFVNICRYRPSWHEIRLKMAVGGRADGTQMNIMITVRERCQICVTAFQPKEIRKKTWICVYKSDYSDGFGELVSCEYIESATKDITLNSGEYSILVSHFDPEKTERNVAIHSSIPIHARLTTWNPYVMTRQFQRLVGIFGKELVKENRGISIKKYSDEDNNYLILMAENYRSQKFLHVNVSFLETNSDLHFEFSRSTRGEFYPRFADVIPPKKRQILIISHRSNLWDKADFRLNVNYSLSEERLTKLGRAKKASNVPALNPDLQIHLATAIEDFEDF